MHISSMTGYVCQDGTVQTDQNELSFTIEIKTVNAKGLEIKTKLPQGLDEFEFEIKNRISRKFSRGTFNVAINFKNQMQSADMNINMPFLSLLQNQASQMYLENPDVFAKPSPAELLAVHGVITENKESFDETTKNLIIQTIFETLEKAFDRLQTDRLAEGNKIGLALLKILDEMESKRQTAENITSRTGDIIRSKITQQINLMIADSKITPERLEQEVLFYIMRADVQEELDRLKSHILTARELFETGGIIGRRLDFLCQELNREANTLCSKSMDLELTKIGMDLKALIEQFREQTQNME